MHALVKYSYFSSTICSGDEDQAQERINKLAKKLREEDVSFCLRSAGVGVISCIIQRDEGRGPMRHSFHWSAEKQYYEEEPLLRNLEPPLSTYLELVCHHFCLPLFSYFPLFGRIDEMSKIV